jgi:alpha-glucosidase
VIFTKETVPHVKRVPLSYAGEDLLHPPYAIDNAAGSLSSRTASVSRSLVAGVRILISCPTRATRSMPTGSSSMTHVSFYRRNWQQTSQSFVADNLYGTMMSVATHNAMLARRPGLRTLGPLRAQGTRSESGWATT